MKVDLAGFSLLEGMELKLHPIPKGRGREAQVSIRNGPVRDQAIGIEVSKLGEVPCGPFKDLATARNPIVGPKALAQVSNRLIQIASPREVWAECVNYS